MRIRNIVFLVSCISILALAYWVLWQSGNATQATPSQNNQSLNPVQTTQTQQIETFAPCAYITPIQKNNLTPIGNSLECAFAEYSALRYAKTDKADRLLMLDNLLRQLVKEIHTLEPADLWLMLWDDKYKKLGLYNDGGMQYTGQLKDEAEGKPISWSPLFKEIAIPPEQQEKYNKFGSLLDRIRTQYKALHMKPESAEKLFVLDNEIRRLVKEINHSELDIPITDDEMGLYDGGGQKYTGKLMSEADKLLPTYVPISVRSRKHIHVPGEKYTKLKDILEQIYSEHPALRMRPDEAEKYYLLDQKIKKTITEVTKYYPFQLSQKFWDNKYEKIGLFIGHYSDQLDYSGKLIVEAHKANPYSRYREQTFFAAIFGEIGSDGNLKNNQPDIKQFYLYLQEFPNSANTPSIYGHLAGFYHGLYKYLRYKPELDKDHYKFKEKCYKPHISERPINEQMLDAQKTGIDFYKKLISLAPQGALRDYYMNELASLEKGENEERDAWCDISDWAK